MSTLSSESNFKTNHFRSSAPLTVALRAPAFAVNGFPDANFVEASSRSFIMTRMSLASICHSTAVATFLTWIVVVTWVVVRLAVTTICSLPVLVVISSISVVTRTGFAGGTGASARTVTVMAHNQSDKYSFMTIG